MEARQGTKRRSELLDQPLPKSVDIERDLLLALITAGDVTNLDGLEKRDFTDPLHREVFEAMQRVRALGVVWLEAGLVINEMGAQARRDAIVEWLEKYRNWHGVVANIKAYKTVLRCQRRRRGLIQIATELLKRAYDPSQPPAETRSWVGKAIGVFDLL